MRKFGCIAAGLLCLLLLGVLIRVTIPGSNYWRAKRFSTAISRQLPLGSSKSQVLAFLKKERIEHSFIDSDFEFESAVRDAGLQPSQLGSMALSMIRQTSWGFLYAGDT